MVEASISYSCLEIRLLGSFRMKIDGAPIQDYRWPRRKPQLLVKLLALQPAHRLHREQVMEILWPELDLESAANNLHKAIHLARRALEPDLKSGAESRFIFTQSQQISLAAPSQLWIDTDEFEQLAMNAMRSSEVEPYIAALELYEGDLLGEEIYEDWATTRREQLKALYRALSSGLARIYEERGSLDQSINCLRKIIDRDPADEETGRELMRLYALTGNRHRALQQYQHCVDSLKRELDVEPDEATVTLYEQIKSETGVEREKAIKTIAVLPLINSGDDATVEYLSDGITEHIINSLSQLPDLKVMARSIAFRYKGERDPIRAGRALGVRTVMAGRVAQLEDRLIISIELIDVADGSQMWGAKYNRSMKDIFAIQEKIAEEISEKLRLRLTQEERQRMHRRHTENARAYQLYLKGRFHWNKRTAESLKKSLAYFEQAIEEDPCYALAYAGLADCYCILSNYGARPPREAFQRAKASALRALEIDPSLAEARASMAFTHFWHGWDWAAAEKEFLRAIDLNPGYATAHHWYGLYLTARGRWVEAEREMSSAQRLDPLSAPINTDFARLFYYARRYDESLERYQSIVEMDVGFVRTRLWMGMCYEQLSMYDEALAEYQKNLSLFGRYPGLLSAMGHTYAVSGNISEARRLLEELKEMSRHRHVPAYFLAMIHAGLDERDSAIEWLEKAYEDRSGWIVWLAIDPRLDCLRRDPRFENLLHRAGHK